MMGLTQELKQLKRVNQSSRSLGLAIFPAIVTNSVVCCGTQHSVKTITIARQVNISRTDMLLDDDDDVAELEWLVPGIT